MIPSSSELYVRELQRQEFLADAARYRLAAQACAKAPAAAHPCHPRLSFQQIREIVALAFRFSPPAARLRRA